MEQEPEKRTEDSDDACSEPLAEEIAELSRSERMLDLQRHLTIVFLSLLIALAAYQLCTFFADILRILAISILISYLFINVVDFIEKYARVRALAILIVYGMMAVATVIGLVVVVPAVVFQVTQLVENVFVHLPTVIEHLTHALSPLEQRLHAAQIDVKAADIITTVASGIPRPDPALLINRVTEITMSTMTWLLYGVSIAVVSFYFLLEGHQIKDHIIKLFPRKYRAALHLMAADMDKNLQGFFRGQVVLAILAGVVMLGVYWALGVSYALSLSVFLALWEIVPVIGPPIGFAPAVIAVAIHGMNFPGDRIIQIIALTIIFSVLQQVKDNVIAPKYIGNVIGLHPVLVFIAIMIGARIDGMLGVIVALPVASVINVFINHLPLRETNTTMMQATLASKLVEHRTASRAEDAESQPPGREACDS